MKKNLIMNNKEEITKEEIFMLRQGDLLNPVGVFRAVLINKCILTKKHFTFLIRKNYLYDKNVELTDKMLKEIDRVWNLTKPLFNDMDLIIKFDDEKIHITHPMDKFFDRG